MSTQKKLLALATTVAIATAAVTSLAFTIKQVNISKTQMKGPQHFVVPDVKHRALPLVGFNFEFENGDHKLREIGVLPQDDKVHSSFSDHNNDDPYRVQGRWVQLPLTSASKRHVAKKTGCQGTCQVPIVAPPTTGDWRVLLSGFKLTRASGDANVQRIAMRPNIQGKYYEVAFHDQNPTANQNKFSVELTYYYYVGAGFTQSGTLNAHKGPGKLTISLKTPVKGLPVISGFDVRYSSGDQHLKNFSLMRGGDGFSASFNDNDLNESVDFSIDYAMVNEAHVAAQDL